MGTTTITVRRENGNIEAVDASINFPRGLTDGMFSQIKKATREAGKGECLSYEFLEDELTEAEATEIKKHDDKCRWFEKHGFNGNDID